jgi:hypothetical protein
VRAALASYPAAEDFVWVQEEPANQGSWSFIALNLLEHLDAVPLRRVSRPAAAAPATGSAKVRAQQAALIGTAAVVVPASDDRHERLECLAWLTLLPLVQIFRQEFRGGSCTSPIGASRLVERRGERP